MLSMRRCEVSGVVNYFSDEDPYLSVGSVVEIRRSGVFHWRCYTDARQSSGVAPDMRTAERRIARLLGLPVSRSAQEFGSADHAGLRLSA